MPSPFELGFILLEHRDNGAFPTAPSLKIAFNSGKDFREANLECWKQDLNRRLRERNCLKELARTTTENTNQEFLKSIKDNLRERPLHNH